MSGADLRAVDVLPRLRAALLRFRDLTAGVPGRLRDRADRANALLARRRRLVEAEIEAQRSQLDEAEDEDDRREIRRALEDSKEELAAIRARSRKLESLVASHDSVAVNFARALAETLPAAAAFLARKHAEASDYLGADPSRVGGGGDGSPATCPDGSVAPPPFGPRIPPERRAEAFAADPTRADSATELPELPPGLVWIPIGKIDPTELPQRDDFRKVPYGMMREGVDRLWSELLPQLAASSGAGRAALEEFDAASGRVDRMGFPHPASLAHLWDKFLERRWHEHVRVEVNPTTGRWSVGNGRHRIRVALDLGWRFIPGELVPPGR